MRQTCRYCFLSITQTIATLGPWRLGYQCGDRLTRVSVKWSEGLNTWVGKSLAGRVYSSGIIQFMGLSFGLVSFCLSRDLVCLFCRALCSVVVGFWTWTINKILLMKKKNFCYIHQSILISKMVVYLKIVIIDLFQERYIFLPNKVKPTTLPEFTTSY